MRPPRGRDERGASAVLVSVFISLVLLVSAAFAVDLGMQRVARRDMQAMADVVALDLARELDGRTRRQLVESNAIEAAKDASVARNEDTLGDDPDLTWELGRIDAAGEFQPVGDADVPSAVRVTSTTTVAFSFGGLTGVDSGGAARQAVAQAEGGACFAIGSYAARLNTSASPILGPLLGALGSNVTLSAIDYNGLANVDVALLDLVGIDLGVGTLESLVQGSNLVSLGGFYLAVAEVISQDHAAQAALLQAAAVGLQDVQLDISDVLGLDTGGASGLDADVNLLDLVTAAASAATGQNALSIPQAGVNLGPLANVGVSLTAIEAPRLGCGRKNSARAVARSTQVRVNLSANAANLNLLLAGTDVRLSGSVSVAQAEGRLTDVRCTPAGITVAVSDGLLNVDLRLQVKVYANILGLRIPVVGGPITITGQTTASGEAVIDIHDEADYDIPTQVGYGSSGLPALSVDTSQVALLGLPVGVVLGPIVSGLVGGLVNPLVAALDTALLSPLLNTLGLDLSGADVYARPTPRCASPKLVG